MSSSAIYSGNIPAHLATDNGEQEQEPLTKLQELELVEEVTDKLSKSNAMVGSVIHRALGLSLVSEEGEVMAEVMTNLFISQDSEAVADIIFSLITHELIQEAQSAVDKFGDQACLQMNLEK